MEATAQQQKHQVHVTKAVIGTFHIIWWRSARQQVSIQPKRKTDKKKERRPRKLFYILKEFNHK